MSNLRRLLAAAILAMTALSAVAMDLNTAKSQGFLGEQQNGYLGLVNPGAPSDAKSLMRQVNDQRRANYQSIARSNGIDLKSVESMAGHKAINKTARGHFIQAPNGQWVRK
jgi:uncharacterized protein YdbL (DUF1318 family)